jgi:type 2A phosphatase activator TIP41
MPPRPPKYEIEKDGQTSTIRIDGWVITATKRPILNGKEIDA